MKSSDLRKEIVDRIVARMKVKGLKPATLSRAANLNADLVRDWLRKETAMPRVDSLAQVAPALGVSPEWLAYGAGNPEGDGVTQTIPLVSWVAASRFAEGPQVTADDGDMPRVSVADLPTGNYIALTVKGDSMDRIAPDGSTIIVRTDENRLVPRDCYVFAGDDGATFKRYMRGPDRLEPYSTNPAHETLPAPEGGLSIVGRVVRVIIDL